MPYSPHWHVHDCAPLTLSCAAGLPGPPPGPPPPPLVCMDEVTLAGEVVADNGRDATTLATMFGIISADGDVSCSPPVPGTGVPVPGAGATEPQVTVVTCRLDDNEDATCMIAISVLPPGADDGTDDGGGDGTDDGVALLSVSLLLLRCALPPHRLPSLAKRRVWERRCRPHDTIAVDGRRCAVLSTHLQLHACLP